MKLKCIKGIQISFKGIAYALKKEQNLRIQGIVAIIVIITGILLNIPKIQILILVLTSFIVIILELLNTGLEKLIDKLSPKYDKDYGKIKDIIGGAALLSVILSIIVGILILYKPVINLIIELFQKI